MLRISMIEVRIYHVLSAGKGAWLSLDAISKKGQVPRQHLYPHLHRLSDAGLMEQARIGMKIYCRLAKATPAASASRLETIEAARVILGLKKAS